jgi:NhaA family Na+:H+ antiporter
LLQKRNVKGWFIYLPLAALIWYLVHESGIHATVAGVAMGLLMNLKQSDRAMHTIHPISAGFAVPVFAFFTAGVFIEGVSITDVTNSPIALGIILGLVIGKPIGVVGVAWLMARFTKASLNSNLSWWDVAAIGALSGVGFTVSLLINELAFKESDQMSSMGTLAVLIASTAAALLAVIALQFRKKAHAKK